MVRALPDSLSELIGLGGVVRVTCKRCGRQARFHPGELSWYFRTKGGRDDWATIRRKFVCKGWGGDGCGSRDVDVSYEVEAPPLPVRPPVSIGAYDCPAGVDPDAWGKADGRERQRLVRAARG